MILAAVIATMVLVSASLSDVRTREVSDLHWFLISSVGIVCNMAEYGSDYVPAAVGSVFLMVAMFSERVHIAVPMAVSSVCAIVSFGIGSYQGPVTFVMFILFYIMYRTGAIKGGADAKALMSIAIAFPFYPSMDLIFVPSGFVSLIFDPAFSTLFLALLFSLSAGLYIAVVNHRNGTPGISSYEMRICDARESFVWYLEQIRDGRKERCAPTDDDSVLDELEEYGHDTVMVSPMIPFIVPITAGFIITVFLGSPLFLLV